MLLGIIMVNGTSKDCLSVVAQVGDIIWSSNDAIDHKYYV